MSDNMEPGNNRDGAQNMVDLLRHAADTLERLPELYAPVIRRGMSFEEWVEMLMYYDPNEPEIMSELIQKYGPPPGEQPHEP